MRLITGQWIVAVLVGAALAQEVPRLSGADLFVDFERYSGKPIVLLNADVFGADNSGALARSGGATFKIDGASADRESFRYFLTNCVGIIASGRCRFSLEATPATRGNVNQPILRDAKILR
jgi:hypothetical protein